MASRADGSKVQKANQVGWHYASTCDEKAEKCKDCPYFDTEAVQLRHVDFGIFQGCIDGETYWHPYTRTPKLGICPMTRERAHEFIADLCEINPELTPDQFVIEPLNKALFSSLQTMAGHYEL